MSTKASARMGPSSSRLRLMCAAAAAMSISSSASALLPHQSSKAESLDGFRLDMPIDEVDALVRSGANYEESYSDPYRFDCTSLLPAGSGAASSNEDARMPISYYLESGDGHIVSVFFAENPVGLTVRDIWYFDYPLRKDWPAYWAALHKRFGKPDLLRPSENDGIEAVWCVDGWDCIKNKSYQRTSVWWHPIPHKEKSRVTIILSNGSDSDANIARFYKRFTQANPTQARRLAERCGRANGTFPNHVALSTHTGDLVGVLNGWSPAISDPNLIETTSFAAIRLNQRSVMFRHVCEKWPTENLRNPCDGLEPLAFRWARSLRGLTLLATIVPAPQGTTTKHGTSTSERRIYFLLRHQSGQAEQLWSGESLLDLAKWMGQKGLGPAPAVSDVR